MFSVSHVFLPNIIAYCQQNRYVRLATFTDWSTLTTSLKPSSSEIENNQVSVKSQSVFDSWCTSLTYVHLVLLAYAWFWTCVFFSYDFLKFSGSYNFILFKGLLLYIWTFIYLFALEGDIFFTVYICICFRET